MQTLSKFFASDDPALPSELHKIIGQDRLAGYLADTGANLEKAISLYRWNAALASAVQTAIGVLEVTLRNSLADELARHFGDDWYDNQCFLTIDANNFKRGIDRAKYYIRSSGKAVTPGGITSGLTFGFWVKLLRPTYGRSLWPIFRPAFAKRTRRSTIEGTLAPLVSFRNRIAHHEVIYDRRPAAKYGHILSGVRLMSPMLEEWIEHHSRVRDLLAGGPFSEPSKF